MYLTEPASIFIGRCLFIRAAGYYARVRFAHDDNWDFGNLYNNSVREDLEQQDLQVCTDAFLKERADRGSN